MHTDPLDRSLTLPCGSVVKNRFLKSAMSEAMGNRNGSPTVRLARLYATWAAGGTGVLVTGNVMIDPTALGEPGNVVLEDARDLQLLRDWAQAGTALDTHLWMQLNHPGKQSPRTLSREPVAPSAVPLGAGLERLFNRPRALTHSEIEAIITRFAAAASIAKDAGFTGVQIHGAHGYLVSQFLSPHHNQRTDDWGGNAERRMRFVLEVYDAIRRAVGPGFPVSIKLNSADFQRGGFSEGESMAVVTALAEAGIDLVEISGGSYEAPVMATGIRDSTKRREAFFLDYAEKMRELVEVPLCVTGGFRTSAGMREAAASGATDMIGLARALAIEPDLPARVLTGDNVVSLVRPRRTGVRAVDRAAMLEVTWYTQQLARMGAGKAPAPNRGPWTSLAITLSKMGWKSLRHKPRAPSAPDTDAGQPG